MWTRALLTFLVALAGSGSLAAQNDPCQPPATDTGFAEVEANIYAGTFSRVLPFDVPLRICTQVPQGTKQLEIKVASGTAPVVTEASSCVRGVAPWGKSYSGRVDSLSSTTVTTARVVVDRLDAQRYYAFCYVLDRPLTADEKEKLKPEVQKILSDELAKFGSGNVTEAELQAHQAAVIDALRQKLLAVTGAEQVETDLTQLFQAALAPQLRAMLIQRGGFANAPGPPPAAIASLQSQLSTALDEVRGSASLDKLSSLLATEAQSNAILRDLLDKSYADALALVDMSDSQAQAAATGQDPDAPASTPTLASATDSATATQAVARLNDTSQAASDLESLIEKMTGTGAPAGVTAGLGADDRASLAALIAPGGAVRRAADLSFTLAGQAQQLAGSLQAREQQIASFAASLDLAMSSVFVSDGSTTGNFNTLSNLYISADAGLVWAPELDEVVPYIGTNIYTRPVNKDASLRSLGTFGQTFRRRFAFTLGLTATSIADGGSGTRATRTDLFANQSLLLGAGLRMTDMVRLGVGALIFKQLDPNPLIDDETTGRAVYITLSFDIDVASTFRGGLGGLLVPSGR